MSARLVYVVEWRTGGAWRFRVFVRMDAALRVSRRVADRHGRALIVTCLPGDVRMMQEGERRALAA